MTGQGERELREVLRRWRGMKLGRRGSSGEGVSPGCVYGLMTRDAIDDLSVDLQDVKNELRWVRMTIVATIVTAAVGTIIRMLGW